MAGFFSRLKGKDGPAKVKKGAQQPVAEAPKPKKWEDAWAMKTVEPEEVQELLRGCTAELKSRALDMPFLLLPFRPTSDPSAARTFIRNFFDRNQRLHGHDLLQELRLTEPMVLCSVVKWCWSRLPGGVVGWDAYEMFKRFERDSGMARSAFERFIPAGIESIARQDIIRDFFNLLSAIAAHGKSNGLGGRKLSRYAAWWAFEYTDDGDGFEGGYKKWTAAADATSHLFFAYLRSQAPDAKLSAISTIPMSLQKLVQESEYPPERPSLLQSSTLKVVMIVDAVSPTPFSLLRRANHFQYRDEDRALQEFADYEDPVKALTDECRRVLRSISSANQSEGSSSKHSTGLTDPSWSRFEDMGFSGGFDEAEEDDDESNFARKRAPQGLRTTPHSKNNGMAGNRPTTPSWADFLSSGFVDDTGNEPKPLLLPPDKVLPPIDTRGRSSQSHRPRLESNPLEPGELASITRFDLDDSFWWVWISSLAGEEPSERKAAFGRCALVETIIRGGKWLVMEEMVQGAAPAPAEDAYIAEKKSFWGRSKKNKTTLARRKSVAEPSPLRPNLKTNASMGASKTSIGPAQHARVQEEATRLRREQEAAQESVRRGRMDVDAASMKTASIFTLATVVMNEASPAMKWANKYDKDAIREAYLGNNAAGLGRGLGEATMQSNGNKSQDTLKPHLNLERSVSTDKELPPMPSPRPVPRSHTPTPPIAQEEEPLQSPGPQSPSPQQSPLEAHPIDRSPIDRNNGAQSSMSKVMSKIPSRAQPTPEPRESMDYGGSSPDDKKHKKLKKKEPGTGGFRKMFGRKNKDSKPPQAHNGGATNGGGLSRKLSGFRKKSITSAPPTPVVESPREVPPRFSSDEVTPIHSPNQAYEHEYDPSIQDSLSRVDTNDAQEAHQAFSSFDQGPLEDVPAFVPEDSPRSSGEFYDAVPADIARVRSSNGEELTQQMSPTQDRWAQIRANAAAKAAKRAHAAENGDVAAARPSEQSSRGGYSQKTGDDETSEEETIESRVARIKARVAELTGNMETTGGSPIPVARPRRT